jgi:hypothetical protein
MASTKSRPTKSRSPKAPAKSKRAAPALEATPTASPSEERLPVYVLDDLHDRTGPSSLDEVAALLYGIRDDALVRLGARVDTTRIETDVARMLGVALDAWNPPKGSRSEALRGVSSALLRACVWSCVQAREAYFDMHDDLRRIKAARKGARKGASSVRGRARTVHAQLLQVLASVVQGNADLEAKVEAAGRIGDRGDAHAGSIDALVAIARSVVAKPSPSVRVRLAGDEAGVTEDWLDACAELAAELRKLGTEGGAPLVTPAVSQADVDLWDGRTITLLRRIMGLYEAANAIDPSVPRLVPIALRTLLVPAKRRSSEPEAPAEPAPPGGGT